MDSSRHQLVHEWDRQPVVGVVLVIDPNAEVFAVLGNSGERARTDIQHVDRSIGKNEEEVGELIN